MKELVLPVSGAFARVRPLTVREWLICQGDPDPVLAMVACVLTVDGEAVTRAQFGEMDIADGLPIIKMLSDALFPLGNIQGVA